MALRFLSASLVKTRVVAAGNGRRLSGILLATGLAALVAGLAIVATSLAPLFVGPSTAPAFTPTGVGQSFSSGDTAIVVAPPAPSNAVVASPAPLVRSRIAAGPIDGVSFELSVPSLGYRAMVYQGVTSNVLAAGPGHYPGTPWPGQRGNVGVAAHNVYWLSFNRLHVGDQVEIQTQHGLYVYVITASQVVNPTNRTVLMATSDNRLTLTTCYPLWAGALATQRLIFSAREIAGVE